MSKQFGGAELSLTNFVKNGEVSKRIDETFKISKVSTPVELLAPPRTKNYTLTGTAFDYVLRFWLKKEYPQAEEREWIAYLSLEKLSTYFSFIEPVIEEENQTVRFKINIGGKEQLFDTVHEALFELPEEEAEFNSSVVLHSDQWPDADPFGQFQYMLWCLDIILEAEERLEEFTTTGIMTDEMLGLALDLAKLDGIYRAGILPENLGENDSEDIKDLRRLYDITPKSELGNHSEIVLNPDFGGASSLVGGADADLILDGKLIDIKTTKSSQVTRDMWRQIVGYAVLADLAREEDKDFPRIVTLGIYYSRHGKLLEVPASEVYGNANYGDFKNWFVETAEIVLAENFVHRIASGARTRL